MLDIKETVDQYTETLAAIQQTQAQHGEPPTTSTRSAGPDCDAGDPDGEVTAAWVIAGHMTVLSTN